MSRLILALVLLALAPIPIVEATSCVPMGAAEQEARADVVVEGTVLSITPGPTRSEVLIGVDRVLKGAIGSEVRLQAGLPGGGFADEVPFHRGWKHWRLYLREIEAGSGRFATTLCDGTQVISAPQPLTSEPSAPESESPAEGQGCELGPLS
ncbi:MAG: hypothetical protein H0V51_09540 [Chloroflexi bacterium]|nr:hypothetical protein [Chloroflexota bacterium]